jgi:2-methylcitrate dehydratase PrpD
MDLSISQKCSNFVCSINWSDIPEKVREQSKYYLLDWMGTLIAGSSTKEASIIQELISDQGGIPQANVMSLKQKTSVLNAAFANGYISHILEVDDLHKKSISHPATTIDSAALSVAQSINASGKDLLLATILGYEIMLRIGEAVTPSHYKMWHTTATCGTFGAAVAAGKLLKLNQIELTNALGNAGTQAAGLWEFLTNGAMSKYLHTGKAAMNGVLSSLLAKKGFTGAIKILEGERGFLKAYSTEKHPEEKFKNLGKPFKILETCTHTHTAIDSVLSIINDQRLNPDQINKVKVYTYDNAKIIAGFRNPQTPIEAKFSLAYCVATVIYYGKVGLEEFAPEKINNPIIKKLMKKVEINVRDDLNKLHPEKWPARVEIYTKDNCIHKAGFDYPKGAPENPLSCEELQQRFINFSAPTIGYSKANNLMEKILKIEEIVNVNQLFSKK